MGIVKKTKEERKDTPLADTPDPTTPVTDLKSALADINIRSAARQAIKDEYQARLNASRIERSKQKKSVAGGNSGLYGLATFRNSTGGQGRES